ncbi:hypothetical protein M0208_14300 [Sphingomonas sp. SUN019]|uniref:hypothetical protein n=1 Tax=Sphingomonas sp. SUN019 TaxID=2937788 RepID=UPI0021644736|nr:hypothetical protein [Sphingomonas sp. SUN019]UVO51618.1 hypothetical protein M0208_14300 [Sphingomonas sp. SUN019]
MSANDDWFRRPCLSDEDRQEFERRLQRARSSRPEYMRIQAGALYATGAYDLSLKMIDRTIADYPAHLPAWLLEQKADCLRSLGEIDPALDTYASSLDRVRVDPGLRGNAHFSFAELVWCRRMLSRYEDALTGLADFWDCNPIFPMNEFKQFGLNALLLEGLGSKDEAMPSARRALAAAAKTRSQATKHHSLGLVLDSNAEIRRALENLVN